MFSAGEAISSATVFQADLPRQLHPALQPHVTGWVLQLQPRGVHFVPAESFSEVGGVFSRQTAGGWQAGCTFGMAHGIALYTERERGHS